MGFPRVHVARSPACRQIGCKFGRVTDKIRATLGANAAMRATGAAAAAHSTQRIASMMPQAGIEARQGPG
jgi:hypothetical protein